MDLETQVQKAQRMLYQVSGMQMCESVGTGSG